MKRNLDKTELDRLAKRLLASTAPGEAEIDAIVSRPDLFGGVMARVQSSARPQNQKPAHAWLSLRFASAAVSAAAVIAVAAFGVVNSREILRTEIGRVPAVRLPEANVPDTARSEVPPEMVVGKLPQGRAIAEEVHYERAAVRQRPALHETRQPVEDDSPKNEFYALQTVAPADPTSGGKIIRVDMPRSALFAMGVNIPLENESPTVKADLIVGSDGVTRAIRVVE